MAEAESLAEKHLPRQRKAEGRAAARAGETRRQLDAIDWDSDSEAEPGA